MKKRKIMVVDDDPIIGHMVQRYLSAIRYLEVTHYQDPMEALKLLESDHVDMVLLDWVMPEVSGLEFLMCMRKFAKTKKTPVYMLTAKNSGTDFEVACDAGVTGYLTKPIDFAELKKHIIEYYAS